MYIGQMLDIYDNLPRHQCYCSRKWYRKSEPVWQGIIMQAQCDKKTKTNPPKKQQLKLHYSNISIYYFIKSRP